MLIILQTVRNCKHNLCVSLSPMWLLLYLKNMKSGLIFLSASLIWLSPLYLVTPFSKAQLSVKFGSNSKVKKTARRKYSDNTAAYASLPHTKFFVFTYFKQRLLWSLIESLIVILFLSPSLFFCVGLQGLLLTNTSVCFSFNLDK